MTQRRALGDLDFDSAFDDPDNGWFGHVQAVEPASSRDHDAHDAHGDGEADTDRWPAVTLDDIPEAPFVTRPTYREPTYQEPTYQEPTYEDPTPAAGEDALDRRPAPEPRATRWAEAPPAASPSWESRLSGSGAWDFKASSSGPRSRPKLAAVGLIIATIAVATLVLLLRGTGPAADESPVPPTAEPSAQPAPTSAPALSTQSQAPLPPVAPGPPLPPPPPPPAAEEISPPVVTRDYTPRRQYAPDDSAKPEIGVTRAPTTRTQMSATPLPPRTPDRNSSTPGDGPKRNGFGF